MMKNVPTADMRHVTRIQKRRRERDGKETEFHVRKRHVPEHKIDRFKKKDCGPCKASGRFPQAGLGCPWLIGLDSIGRDACVHRVLHPHCICTESQ
jgi:hypothetical protein